MKTYASRPADAACAATLFARLPVEAHASVLNPNSRAFVAATVTTRSLNDQVGLAQSFLIQRFFRPRCSPRFFARTRGVNPALMSTAYSGSAGSRSAYRQTELGPRSIVSRG